MFASGILSHDVAPDGAVGAAIVINDHHITFSYIIDKVTDGSRRATGRDVPHSEGWADSYLAVVVQWNNAQALARQPQFVQGIGYAGGIQPFE
ncbi:hypothetical protein D3C85_1251330 [compost metagenome]